MLLRALAGQSLVNSHQPSAVAVALYRTHDHTSQTFENCKKEEDNSATDHPARNGEVNDVSDDVLIESHSTASRVISMGVTIVVSPVSLSVLRKGLRA